MMAGDELEDLEAPGVGHNSGETPEEPDDGQVIVAAELRQLIERVERLEAEKKDIANDIKEVYAEAKGRGYDTKAMRACVRARAMDDAKREEERAVTEMYFHALGMM